MFEKNGDIISNVAFFVCCGGGVVSIEPQGFFGTLKVLRQDLGSKVGKGRKFRERKYARRI